MLYLVCGKIFSKFPYLFVSLFLALEGGGYILEKFLDKFEFP